MSPVTRSWQRRLDCEDGIDEAAWEREMMRLPNRGYATDGWVAIRFEDSEDYLLCPACWSESYMRMEDATVVRQPNVLSGDRCHSCDLKRGDR